MRSFIRLRSSGWIWLQMGNFVVCFVVLIWIMSTSSGGEVHKYSPRSIHAHSDDVSRTLLDGNVDTCLQFLGGTGGTAPWYTHLTIPLPHNGSFHSNVTGHNLGCGESLTLVIWSDDQGNQRGKRTKCRLDHVYGENGVEICTQMCSCPDGSCDKLDIIHRPMSSQPSSWKLCDIMEVSRSNMARHTGTTCTYSSAMTNYGCTKALDGSLAYQDEWIALDSDGRIVWITVTFSGQVAVDYLEVWHRCYYRSQFYQLKFLFSDGSSILEPHECDGSHTDYADCAGQVRTTKLALLPAVVTGWIKLIGYACDTEDPFHVGITELIYMGKI